MTISEGEFKKNGMAINIRKVFKHNKKVIMKSKFCAQEDGKNQGNL